MTYSAMVTSLYTTLARFMVIALALAGAFIVPSFAQESPGLSAAAAAAKADGPVPRKRLLGVHFGGGAPFVSLFSLGAHVRPVPALKIGAHVGTLFFINSFGGAVDVVLNVPFYRHQRYRIGSGTEIFKDDGPYAISSLVFPMIYANIHYNFL